MSARGRLVDVLGIGALMTIGLIGLLDAAGGAARLVPGMAGLATALLLSLAGVRWGWGPLRLAGAVLLSHLILGTAVAVPAHARLRVLPTPASLIEVLTAPVTSWRSMLASDPSAGAADAVLAVSWMSVLVLGTAGFSLALRTPGVLAWLAPLAMMGLSILLGTSQAVAPILRGALFAAISLAWLSGRGPGARQRTKDGAGAVPSRRRMIGGGIMLVIAAALAVPARRLLVPPEGTARAVVRDAIAPPFDPRREISPLSRLRGLRTRHRDRTLLEITGAAVGERVQLAALDTYDLHVFTSSGTFLRTAPGTDLDAASGSARTARITAIGYEGIWIPTLGSRILRIDPDAGTDDLARNLYVDRSSQAAVSAAGLTAGDGFTLTYTPYAAPRPADLRALVLDEDDLPPLPALPPEVEQFARSASGASGSDHEMVEDLVAALRSSGVLSHGAGPDEATSLSGHSISRLLPMLSPEGRIGDEEQFAALAVLLARSLAIPARVVVGFRVPAGAGATARLTGADATAWIEVRFQGEGWVRFDPAPGSEPSPSPPAKEPAAAAPAPTARASAASTAGPEAPGHSATGQHRIALAAAGASPVLLTPAAITALKAVRRRRRRTRGGSSQRIDGGWQEILDLHADLGRGTDGWATRAELARRLEAETPGGGFPLLAHRTDRGVFGPEELPQADVEEHWRQVDRARIAMLSAVPRHRRLRARTSLRSLRRPGASRPRERREVRALARRRAASAAREEGR